MKKQKYKVCVALLTVMVTVLAAGISQAEPEVTQERDTLENQAILTGTAQKDTWVYCSVYTYDEDGEVTLLYQSEQQVGGSGLYQLTVPLPVLGRQYVAVRMSDEEIVYVYNRYRKQLARDLKDYYLNVYQAVSGASS